MADSDVLPQADPQPHESLALLLIDQRRRWSLGDRKSVEEYCRQNPQLASSTETLLDLIFQEVVLRERQGELPTVDEYVGRFPKLETELHLQFDVDREITSWQASGLLEESSSLDVADVSTKAVDTRLPQVEGYEVEGLVGRGGMAVVYRARHIKLNRPVALKLLRDRFGASSTQIRRFWNEAQAAARMQHPNIVQIFEVGQHAGQPFLALEYLAGGTLAEQIQGRPHPPRFAARVVETLARAVQVAHEHGVLHRDLKPGNVMFEKREQWGAGVGEDSDSTALQQDSSSLPTATSPLPTLKITDFGLAKLIDAQMAEAESPATTTGDILGTAAYMSPEQAQGEVGKLTAATDVYSLGAILYELLTGRPPFVGTKPLEVIAQVLSDEPPRPSQLVRRIPVDAQTICLKCLEKNPQRRYATAQELADDLARFLRSDPIVARHTTSLERSWRWCRRHPAAATLLGSLVTLVTTIAVAMSTYSILMGRQLARTEAAQVAEHEAKTQALERLWDSYLSEADARRTSGQMGQRFASLAAIDKANNLDLDTVDQQHVDRMRTATIACLALPDMRKDLSWTDPNGVGGLVAFGTTRYVNVLDEHIAVVSREEDGVEIARVNCDQAIKRLVLSPDETMLAVINDHCRVYRLDSSPPAQVFESSSRGWWNFSPDSKRILGADGQGVLTLFDIGSGQARKSYGNHVSVARISFSPNGLKAAVVTNDAVHVIRLKDGLIRTRLEAPYVADNSTPTAWHPNSRILAVGPYPGLEVVLWDATTGERLDSFRHHGGELQLCFNSVGDWLLSNATWEGTTVIWNAASGRKMFATTKTALADVQADARGGFRCWSVSSPNQLVAWKIEFPRVHRVLGRYLDQPLAETIDVSFRQDGRLAAVTTTSGIRIYRTCDWKVLRQLLVGYSFARFDATGSLVVWSKWGLHRWPAREIPQSALALDEQNDTKRVRLEFGPPQKLLSRPAYTSFDIALDGQSVVIPDGDHATLWRAADPDRSTAVGSHIDTRAVSISPDGQWLATGAWEGEAAKVWSLTTRKLLKTLATGSCGIVQFSPDGKWLLTNTHQLALWRVHDWKKQTEFAVDGTSITGVSACFSPDSRLIAVSDAQARIQLFELETGRVIVTLLDPNQQLAGGLAFSPNGRQLLVKSRGPNGEASVWDLAALRQESCQRGLDWSQADSSAWGLAKDDAWITNTSSFDNELTVRFVTDRHFQNIEAAMQVDFAEDALKRNEVGAVRKWISRAAKHDLQEPSLCNRLAWLMAAGPPDVRDLDRAIDLAQRAVAADPDVASYANTLGVAFYRGGRYRESITWLETSLAANKPPDQPCDLLFLSMCYAELGDPTHAQELIERARELLSQHADTFTFRDRGEIEAFTREADAALRQVIDDYR